MKKASDSNLDFDGMAGDGVNRAGNKYAGNHSGMTMGKNYGRGPTKGNQSDSSIKVGPSVTRDPHQMTISTSAGGKINGGAQAKCPPNPDSIYMGK